MPGADSAVAPGAFYAGRSAAKLFAGHSLRSGFLTSAAAHGTSEMQKFSSAMQGKVCCKKVARRVKSHVAELPRPRDFAPAAIPSVHPLLNCPDDHCRGGIPSDPTHGPRARRDSAAPHKPQLWRRCTRGGAPTQDDGPRVGFSSRLETRGYYFDPSRRRFVSRGPRCPA